MQRFQSLLTAVEATRHLPFSALWGHLMRRVRNKLVPKAPGLYRRRLQSRAERLPPFAPQDASRQIAAVTATFFRAKHAKNAQSCLEGRFTFLNKTIDFGGVDKIDWLIQAEPGNHQAWRSNLGFMGYLCSAAEQDPHAALALAGKIVDTFPKAADFSASSQFNEVWHPYGASQRSLALATFLTLTAETLGHHPTWARVEQFLRFNIAFVAANLETELGLNHYERNLSALALYALGAQTPPRALLRQLKKRVLPLIRSEIGADGAQLERSAMYQALTIQSLKIFLTLDIWSPQERRELETFAAQAQHALQVLTLGDDAPVMFNDAWIGETPLTSQIIPAPPPGFAVLPQAGYARLAQDETVVVFDAGPIGVDSNPGHGHADFLSFEASIGAHRLVVDPGTYSYTMETHGPDAIRNQIRAWTSHNGPVYLDGAPVAYQGSFKVGRRAAARLTHAEDTPAGQIARGALSFDQFSVTRSLRLSPGQLQVEDRWLSGQGPRRIRFLIPDAWSLTRQDDDVLLVQGLQKVRIRFSQGVTMRIGQSRWSRAYNQWEGAHEIILEPAQDRATVTFTWDAPSAPARARLQEDAPLATSAIDSILAFPRRQSVGGALYNTLLYDALETLGAPSQEYRRFAGRQPSASLFHFHWPDRVFGGAAKVVDAMAAVGARRFLDTMKDFRDRQRPVVWTAHNAQPHDFRKPQHKALYDEMVAQFDTLVSAYIFLNHYSRDLFLAEHPHVSPSACAVIPHMITPIAGRLTGQHAPPELRSRAANPSFLLSPGHIRRYKNLQACIALFDRIKAPGQIFVIAGPAADRAYADEIQAQIAGRNDILMISRELSDTEINWCYQNADAVLSLRSPEGNSGVMFSALSNSARVITRPGPVTTEIAQQVGPGWLIEVSDDDQQIAADIANKPTKPPQLQWCHPTIIAQQHLNFMNSLLHK